MTAAWDASMPLDFSNGNLVDEGDLDPIVHNLHTLKFATVFLGGQRRTTGTAPIGSTEAVLATVPPTSLEGGYIHRIEGMVKYTAANVGGLPLGEVRIREGTTTTGVTLVSYAIDSPTATHGRVTSFSIPVAIASTTVKQYVVTLRVINAVGNITVSDFTWIGVNRAGDLAMMPGL